MKTFPYNRPGWLPRRKGLTLVEMLVTVAILVLMMTMLAQIFQAALGTMSAAQSYQDLDITLRQLDGTIRSDLRGVTATFTPPLDPKDNKGYFEYGENEFPDLQGEDTDDYIRFTAKAPEGRPFSGRMFVRPPSELKPFTNWTAAQWLLYSQSQPITITSQYAEIIYFLRNGNLYRRVLLVAPDRQSAIYNVNDVVNAAAARSRRNSPALGGNLVSWQGLNDLSARPAKSGPGAVNPDPDAEGQGGAIVLNTLGDLTNRENRAFSPRFGDDFLTIAPDGTVAATFPDGQPDDGNLDGVPDYYPTLHPGAFGQASGQGLVFQPPAVSGLFGGLDPLGRSEQVLAFPFIFPGAYSRPQAGTTALGWIHSPTPFGLDSAQSAITFDANPALYLQLLNHGPLDLGDNLPRPGTGANPNIQTWWGFPTWRETLSPAWNDPTFLVNRPFNTAYQPFGLYPRPANSLGADGRVDNYLELLPPMTPAVRQAPQPYTDGWGSSTRFLDANTSLWNNSWEDDLIATGVRSFDVKGYDESLGTYADLGWGDDVRGPGFQVAVTTANPTTIQPPVFLLGNADQTGLSIYPPLVFINNARFDLLNKTLAHEGRMPPRVADNRLDAQFPNPSYRDYPINSFVPQYPAYPGYSSNVGDDNAYTIRLRRVWETWSTDYTRAPATGYDFITGRPIGPPYSPPVYPSYPPPYPAPLRGIQIQIRVVDPRNERIKTLTIKQDFSDKL